VIIFLVVFTLPATSLLLLQNNKIQTKLTQYLTEKVSESLNTSLSIEQVYITFFNRILIKNMVIKDLNGKTMLDAEKVKITIGSFKRKSKEITFRKITVNNAEINLIRDSSNTINIKVLVDELINEDKPHDEKFKTHFKRIDVKESRFFYTDILQEPHLDNKTIDFAHIELNDFNCSVKNLETIPGKAEMNIKDLSFTDKTGFELTKLNAHFEVSGSFMEFSNLMMLTPSSEISANAIDFNFNSFQDFSNFATLVDMKLNFRSSSLNLSELSHFTNKLESISETIRFSGVLEGSLSNLSGDKLLLAYKDQTQLNINFNMFGLPDITQTFMDFDINYFQTSIENFKTFQNNNKLGISLPANFDTLGIINYYGKFTGYYDDFVAFGKISSDQGNISLDIMLNPDSSKTLSYRGLIKTYAFNIGSLVNSDIPIGELTANFKVDGTKSKNDFSGNLTGEITNFQFNNYNYKNLDITGYLANNIFDGSFKINDPNIQFDFLGKVDFQNDIPEFNFTADVGRIRPYYLNFPNTYPSYFTSCLLKADFKGKSIDELEGEINLINSFFKKDEEQIQIYDFNLTAEHNDENSIINISSDIIDAEISGQYQFSKLIASFRNLSQYYIPALGNGKKWVADTLDRNNFNYNVKLKNINEFSRFFFEGIELANNTIFEGNYAPLNSSFRLNAKTDYLVLNGKEFKNIEVLAYSNPRFTKVLGTSNGLFLNNEVSLDNIKLNAQISDDTINMNVNWDNKKNPENSGNIDILTDLSNNPDSDIPHAHVQILPSYFTFNKTNWNISPAEIYFDSASIYIDSFDIRHNSQSLLVHGKMSGLNNESLKFYFDDLDMSILNIFTQKLNISLAGNVSGKASLSSLFNNPLFLSDLSMSDLVFNQQSMGDGELKALWNNEEKKIHLLSYSQRGLSEIFRIEGDYFPNSRKIDFNFSFDKLNLKSISPYTTKLISELKGLSSGRLKLAGTLNKPILDGEINLFKTSFIVNYLQTRYNLSDNLEINNNIVFFKDFKVFDAKGNSSSVNGKILSQYLRNINLDLTIETDNFEFLNTNSNDNEMFYGNIFAGGVVNIYGPPNNLTMNIDARSGRNSIFYIPLYGSEEINETNFIKFVKDDNEYEKQETNKSEYSVDLTGITMNFILEVTPDAEVQLIFDPKIGDILRGKGSGNLRISINSLGKFEILGEIVIEEGDYLFTLQNVINKKFEVKKGGTITWNGNPEDANINLDAFYELRTSVYNLAPDETNDNLKKRIPVECQISMTGKLMNPKINPKIVLPTAEQEIRNIVNNSINTDEEVMKQFLSLLVINSFYSDQLWAGESTGSTSTAAAAGVATSELLSNQLSHWLSQINEDFDIGLNYRPGDEISSDELEVALSTQIINERVTINGNLDVGGNQNTPTATTTTTNTNNIVGDFDIDFQITENGKFHLKAFNRSNDNLLFPTSPYTQGVGIFYREDFNTFSELYKRYKDAIRKLFTRTGKEEKNPKEPQALNLPGNE